MLRTDRRAPWEGGPILVPVAKAPCPRADRYPFHAPAPGLAMDKSRIERVSGFALIALGVIFYLVFGLVRGHPTDLGVYSITVVPLVAGLGLLWRTGRPDTDTR